MFSRRFRYHVVSLLLKRLNLDETAATG